jgi:hypothetical protein
MRRYAWCRRSNRPGNSQAKGPAGRVRTLENDGKPSAEGITISGKGTEGA